MPEPAYVFSLVLFWLVWLVTLSILFWTLINLDSILPEL